MKVIKINKKISILSAAILAAFTSSIPNCVSAESSSTNTWNASATWVGNSDTNNPALVDKNYFGKLVDATSKWDLSHDSIETIFPGEDIIDSYLWQDETLSRFTDAYVGPNDQDVFYGGIDVMSGTNLNTLAVSFEDLPDTKEWVLLTFNSPSLLNQYTYLGAYNIEPNTLIPVLSSTRGYILTKRPIIKSLKSDGTIEALFNNKGALSSLVLESKVNLDDSEGWRYEGSVTEETSGSGVYKAKLPLVEPTKYFRFTLPNYL